MASLAEPVHISRDMDPLRSSLSAPLVLSPQNSPTTSQRRSYQEYYQEQHHPSFLPSPKDKHDHYHHHHRFSCSSSDEESSSSEVDRRPTKRQRRSLFSPPDDDDDNNNNDEDPALNLNSTRTTSTKFNIMEDLNGPPSPSPNRTQSNAAGTSESIKSEIAPFLRSHIPLQYNSSQLEQKQTAKSEIKREVPPPSTARYCYRHRPDLKCRRQADEPTMEQLQSVSVRISLLPSLCYLEGYQRLM